MLQSMTGFGKASGQIGGKTVDVEIRSLNSKQLDLNMRLPHAYYGLEAEIRTLIPTLLDRGKVDLYIGMGGTEGKSKIALNAPLAKQYAKEFKALAKELGEKDTAYLPLILRIPDVFKAEEKAGKKEIDAVLALVRKAAIMVSNFRQQEGKALKKDIESHLAVIEANEKKIDKCDPNRVAKLRERLMAKINEGLNGRVADLNRFEQEIIYYIEKFDINEEKARLKNHCSYFRQTMNEPNGGRKLGFIVQEIGREINTIGSKANDAEIQRHVVEMKDELEKIKEQLLNIL
ncbi:MAG TPA: YicC/YloC family endoribonuclease [Bacteroidia bacterium]|nr:YicC/YloC family endoribonuclease [Bacteroidia bacterium]